MWIIAAIAGVVLAGAAVWYFRFQTYHLSAVHENVLYRCGNRDVRELRNAIRQVRPKVVVTLVDDGELIDPLKPQFAQEAAALPAMGVRLERIPIRLGGWPTTADVRRFLDLVADPANQPVLVHCAQGVRRTGMLVAAYQESMLGYDDPKTQAAMLTFGHSRRTVGDIERFIRVYDAGRREVTEELPQSQE